MSVLTFPPQAHQEPDELYGLRSTWSATLEAPFSSFPSRFEGEVADLIVCGQIPSEISGTFYRIMVDPFYPLHPDNDVPIEGDGNVSAFRIHNGRVDMKIKYVETERYKLDRNAQKTLFGLYRNPFTHHPCVRAAVDSTANTNLLLWADHLLALKESALPYALDPDTLETRMYDPFGSQIKAKTFSAHPKVDPFTDELVVFGYEAKGLATLDIVVYALDEAGNKKDEQWIKSPWCAMIHDCAISPNWLILALWPFEADIERMKAGKHHWAYNYDRPATFIVVPRRKNTPRPDGWREGEYRVYSWENCMTVHTAGAWEGDDGKLYMESSRVFDNVFPCFAPDGGRMPSPQPKADFVRWEFDLSKPSGSKVLDPLIVLDVPSEMPRTDERFLTKAYDHIFLNVILPDRPSEGKLVPVHLNGLAMVNTKSGKTQYFNPGQGCHVQEPIFIPRSRDAPPGDGWVMSMIERKTTNRSDLVLLDTMNFEKPVAIIQLPFQTQGQIHGNWVGSSQLKVRKSFVQEIGAVRVSGRGALELE